MWGPSATCGARGDCFSLGSSATSVSWDPSSIHPSSGPGVPRAGAESPRACVASLRGQSSPVGGWWAHLLSHWQRGEGRGSPEGSLEEVAWPGGSDSSQLLIKWTNGFSLVREAS